MFGGPLKCPKIDRNQSTQPVIREIQLPHPITAQQYGHYGRAPNTDYQKRMLLYKQRQNELLDKSCANEQNRLYKDRVWAKYEKHANDQLIQARINVKFEEKMKAYEGTIEKRRQKLRELYAKEEIDNYAETVEICQKAELERLTEIKQQLEIAKAQREAERLEIVEQKRHQQFIQNCSDLRPVVIKQNLIQTKQVQYEQIKDNQKKKEMEKDLENLWHQLKLKDQQACKEYELRQLQKRNKDSLDVQAFLQKQIETKDVLKEENKRKIEKDHLEMLELQQQMQCEQIAELDRKRKERDRRELELKQQIEQHERFLQERKRQEQELDEFYLKLAKEKLEEEQAKIQDTTAIVKRETKLYQQYLRDLQEERKREEEQLMVLLDEHRKMIEEKQDQAKCDMLRAKQALLNDVMKGRDEQLQLKQQQIENELKMKQAENELLKMAMETNERLQAEHDRLNAENARIYKAELKRQIEMNNERRKREKDEMEREYRAGLEEEQRLKAIIEDYKKSIKPVTPHKHPFKKVFDAHAIESSKK